MLGPQGCFINTFLELFAAHVRAPKNIEHGANINTDIALEFYYLRDSYFDIAVDIGLEGTRISDYYTREVEH